MRTTGKLFLVQVKRLPLVQYKPPCVYILPSIAVVLRDKHLPGLLRPYNPTLTVEAFRVGWPLSEGTYRAPNGEQNLIAHLRRVCYGTLNDEEIYSLNSTSATDTIAPRTHTHPCLTNNAASAINRSRLDDTDVDRQVFEAETPFTSSEFNTPKTRKRLDAAASQRLELKRNSLVVLPRKCGDLLPGTVCTISIVLNHRNFRRTHQELRVLADGLQRRNETGPDQVNYLNAGVTVSVTKFGVHSFDRKSIACRMQLPVIMAYAMTAHRSQGFDLDSVANHFSQSLQLH